MWLEQTPEEFRTRFLLKFIKEVIENTEAYHTLRIKEEVKVVDRQGREKERKIEEIKAAQKEGIKEIVQEKIKKENEKLSEMYIKGLPLELKALSAPLQVQTKKTSVRKKIPLKIPEHVLPETVSYLKPTPTSEQIDLGKLNILLNDPLVKIIECNGPDENIFVGGIMGRKPTAIKLSKEEIQDMVEKFSSVTKIPLHEGLFKAALGNVVLSAVVSEIAGIKFVIRKISQGF